MAETENPKPVVVEAVGVAARGGVTGAEIEQAMSAAVVAAMAKGIVDPDKLREIKQAARQKVKDVHAVAAGEAARQKELAERPYLEAGVELKDPVK